VVNEHMVGDKRIVSAAVVIGGRWWHPHDSSAFRSTGEAA
jgi:dihydroorotase